MHLEEKCALSRSTTFSEEISELSRIRTLRRKKIKKYPSVSVIIATLRPADLSSILSQLKTQTLESFELAIGLHGIDLNEKLKCW